MSRTMPSECDHGAIYDWGDFGPGDVERCRWGCNDEFLTDEPQGLTEAATRLLAAAELLKQRDAEIAHLRDAIWRLTAAAEVAQ